MTDRQALQAAGTHPAPCARHCEAKAFEIEIRLLKSALRAALAEEALQRLTDVHQEIEAVLEQPEQEPVVKYSDIVSDGDLDPRNKFDTQPQRMPLTWEQVLEIGLECANDRSSLPFEIKIARAIEAAHGIKGEV